MSDSTLFKKELIFLEMEIENKEDFFKKLNLILLDKKYVTDNFYNALVKREENYPTGIQTSTIGVAIPHTDPINIIEPFIAIIRPTKKVDFQPMGIGDNVVEAELIFLLGVKRDGGQVAVLQNLMEIFMNDESVKELLEAKTSDEMLEKINKYFN